jgi:CRP/FNR family cyclic AMP-dependent transcriptional regulator
VPGTLRRRILNLSRTSGCSCDEIVTGMSVPCELFMYSAQNGLRFRMMPHMDLTQLFRHETGLFDVPAGHVIFKEGDAGDVMLVLMSGIADITIKGRLVETAESGALLGEMALIDASPRAATVTARTDCKLLPIQPKRFHFLIQQTPNFAIHVMRVMAGRLRRTDDLL